MYTAFYRLFEKPFSLTPDPRYLFFSDGHREALAHLRYGIEQGEGFIAVTGEVGTGKSTLCRALIEGLDAETEVAFLFNPPRSATELLQAIALEFGLSPAGHQRHALNDQLNRFLLDRKKQRRSVLLIIDEAQNLDANVLEEIRLLSNLETASSKLIQIILLGQPELDRKLESNELRQLRQRISVRWFLTPLTRSETSDYVAHRLHVAAGGKRDLFTSAALRQIYKHTRGTPRRINLLADRSLLAGFAAEQERIGSRIVRRAAREIAGKRVGAGRDEWKVAARIAAALVLFVVAGFLGNRVGTSGLVDGFFAASTRVSPLTAASVEAPVNTVKADLPATSTESVHRGEGLQPSEAPSVSASPPQRELSQLVAGEIDVQQEKLPGSRGDRLRNTLAPGSFLGRLLGHQQAGEARETALNAILESYGHGPMLEAPADDKALADMFASRGLAMLSIEEASLETLRTLNHPAFLSMRTERGEPSFIALLGLHRDAALVFGATGSDPIEVATSELNHLWDGVALIVWKPLAGVPQLITGREGADVVEWLQQALGELGLYQGAASGQFDAETARSVRVLQAGALIEPDGIVGPRTQMVIYSKLTRVDVPRIDLGVRKLEALASPAAAPTGTARTTTTTSPTQLSPTSPTTTRTTTTQRGGKAG